MRRTLRVLALLIMLLAVVGVFNTPVSSNSFIYAEGTGTVPLCPPSGCKPPTQGGLHK